MNRLYYPITHWLFALLLTLFFIPDVHGTKKSESALIITSFQIEMNSYRSNINELYHELNREHPDMQYYVENMNCRSLSEINEWRGRMSGFLHKYEEEKPSFVILVLTSSPIYDKFTSLRDYQYFSTFCMVIWVSRCENV